MHQFINPKLSLYFYILLGSAFTINNETGQISTRKELDRETKSQYLLVVKVTFPPYFH